MRALVSESIEWYIIESTPSELPPGKPPVRFGPFMSEGECRTVLDGVKQIGLFNHSKFELERHRKKDSRDKRFAVKRLVRLCESGASRTFQAVHTVNVSITGVRLGGLREKLRLGAVYTLRCGEREAPFQVVWMGSGPTEDQAGLECLAPELNMWELDLTQLTEEERLLREIGRARTVQSRLFPQETLPLRTLDYSGHCIQARTVGGDYYDFLAMGPGEVGFVVADVCGKGIAAALLMANFHGGLHAQCAAGHGDLRRVLASVNRQLFEHTESDRYVTVFLASYTDDTRKLRYVNCGHSPPVWLRRDGAVEHFTATATVIGLFRDWEGSVAEVQIEPGDVVSMYTDGITEARGNGEEEFGLARLVSTLGEDRGPGAASLVQRVERAVEEFRRGEQHDDATLVVACSR